MKWLPETVEVGVDRGGGDERQWWGVETCPGSEREDGGKPVKKRTHERWEMQWHRHRLWDHRLK
jgi:hypothetical protein